MIQDIAPGVLHQEYTQVLPKENDTVFLFQKRQVLARAEADGAYSFPTVKEIAEALSIRTDQLQYLFRIDEDPYFLLLDETKGVVPGFEYIPLMKIRWSTDNITMFSCMTAFHLFTWYDKARFCGRCGTKLQHAATERMLKCPECGNQVFPMIAPAVIVGVINGEHLLMTKYADRAYKGWALIAGFCEIGESVEDTVRREVMEEAGVRVKNLRYVASQPWGTDSNLLIGVFCELDGDGQIHMDQEELSRALWVKRKDVPDMRDNQSLTGYMIELFRTGREKAMRIHDITQEVFNCEVYPGDPVPEKNILSSIANGDSYNLSAFSMCSHNGTHIDAPNHFLGDGKTVDEISLDTFVGMACVAEHQGIITGEDAAEILKKAKKQNPEAAKRILIKGDVEVSLEAANAFAVSELLLLGSESQTFGSEDTETEVHRILLSADVVLLEGVRLTDVSEGVYLLNTAPLNLGGAEGSPCRAVLIDTE